MKMEELFGNISGSEPELVAGGRCNPVDCVAGGSGDEGSRHNWSGDEGSGHDWSGSNGNGGDISGNDGNGGGGGSGDDDRLKHNRKRMRHEFQWVRNIWKYSRCSRQAYVSIAGRQVRACKIGGACNCKKACLERMNEPSRQSIFSSYYALES